MIALQSVVVIDRHLPIPGSTHDAWNEQQFAEYQKWRKKIPESNPEN